MLRTVAVVGSLVAFGVVPGPGAVQATASHVAPLRSSPRASQSTAPGAWGAMAVPAPVGLGDNELDGVSCAQGGVCTAVGYSATEANGPALVESLGSTGWVLASTPEAPGSLRNQLSSVSCVSASMCVAVGYSQSPGVAARTLIETFADGTWTLTPSPDAGARGSYLSGVSCVAAGSCVAVGYYLSASGAAQTLIETFANGSWQITASMDRGYSNNRLNAVSCADAPSCTAVGYYQDSVGKTQTLVETLANGTWGLVVSADRSPDDNELSSVSCAALGSCVAVGYYSNGHANQTLAETLVDGTWAPFSNTQDRSVANNELSSVSCAALGSCVAVGYYSNGRAERALVEALAGGSWRVGNSPDQGSGDNALVAVSCASEASCASVGRYSPGPGTYEALAVGLQAGSWVLVASEGESAPSDILTGVSCASPGSCVAVGYDQAGSGEAQALVETLANGYWSVSPGTGPAGTTSAGTASYLTGVSCASPGSCVAVGYDQAGSGEAQALVETLANGYWSVWPGTGLGSTGLGATASYLTGVSCASAGSCVAVGYDTSAGTTRALVESLANGVWSVEPSADPGIAGNHLSGVSCPSSGSCVAVGYSSNGHQDQALVESLANGSWVAAPPSGPGRQVGSLEAVSCPSAGSCVAVGQHFGAISAQVLVESLVAGSWLVVPGYDSSSAQQSLLDSVSCPVATSCTAVGWYQDGGARLTLAEAGTTSASVPTTATTTTTTTTTPRPAATTTSLSSRPNPVVIGQEVIYVATVRPGPGGGTVSFIDDGAVMARCRSVAVSHEGTATCSTKYSSAGNHVLQAAFSGNARFMPSTSSLYDQLVDMPAPLPQGYWLATRSGAVFGAGAAKSLGGVRAAPSDPVVGIAAAPGGKGYWLATADGAVTAFGSARYFGDLPALRVHVADIVAIASTPNGRGYWLVGRDGGFFAFGDATYHGSLPGSKIRVSDIVGMVASQGGLGYLLVGRDGGVFTFGRARFHGSLPGLKIHVSDIRAILPSSNGAGYVLVGADGGAFVFGSGVHFYGSLPGDHLKVSDVVGIALTPDGQGYFMAASDGAVYGFGNAKAKPVPVGLTRHLPVVAIAGV